MGKRWTKGDKLHELCVSFALSVSLSLTFRLSQNRFGPNRRGSFVGRQSWSNAGRSRVAAENGQGHKGTATLKRKQ